MAIELTETGWVDLLGNENEWTDFADVVDGQSFDSTAGTSVASGVVAASGGGADTIAGFALSSGAGLEVQGELQTNQGADLLVGSSVGSTGIVLTGGIIGTGQGDDKVNGQGLTGINLDANSFLLTKAGDDVIIGSGLGVDGIGILNQGTIEMDVAGVDEGDDLIKGVGNIGIFNSGTITFGSGNDTLSATSTGGGRDLQNSGTIRMGAGADTVSLEGDSLMAGNGEIFLGAGGDTFFGFGEVDVHAGDGVNDTLILPTQTSDFSGLAYAVIVDDTTGSVSFAGVVNGPLVIMTTTGFETLIYGDQSFNIADLTGGEFLTPA